MNVVTIIQARMGSTRLPGKVLKNLADSSVLSHVVQRCKAIRNSSSVVIATTTEKEDARIVEEADRLDINCYRGSEHDVLSRYYEAAEKYEADVIVRVTSDCPMLDPEISGDTIQHFLEQDNIDYCSNVGVRKFPRGLDTEVISFKALSKAYHRASKVYEREHVCPFIIENPTEFKVVQYQPIVPDYSLYRWTLDTEEDYKFIQEVYKHLYSRERLFSWEEAIQLMKDYPHLPMINAHIEQKSL
ncbi:cytidylyltransferase domain-containing protein [Paenibacillus ferrarius]|uniref:cytidylyltransferase domain-containing protein n=1 Tax=Paenibacillus ferrarius TaxID=1469647 RepID=UPI003D2A1147